MPVTNHLQPLLAYDHSFAKANFQPENPSFWQIRQNQIFIVQVSFPPIEFNPVKNQAHELVYRQSLLGHESSKRNEVYGYVSQEPSKNSQSPLIRLDLKAKNHRLPKKQAPKTYGEK